MAQNTAPIFGLVANVGRATILPATTANVKSDGTGTLATDILKAFTAGTNGSIVYSIRFTPVASTAATATTATTLRAFESSITSGATTNADTYNLCEVSAAAQTADHSTNAIFYIEVPINKYIPSGHFVHVTTHVVAAAATAWQVLVFGADY